MSLNSDSRGSTLHRGRTVTDGTRRGVLASVSRGACRVTWEGDEYATPLLCVRLTLVDLRIAPNADKLKALNLLIELKPKGASPC